MSCADGWARRRVRTSDDWNGVELDVVDAGTHGAPVVVLAHGFPESSYSWRHQVAPLVEAGYRVLAPDHRGYARSSAPRAVAAYRSDHLAGDLVALLDGVGADRAFFVGHDRGARLVWDLARYHPDRVSGIVNVSVPYAPWPMRPTELFRETWGDRFFYMTYFQTVGPAETELEADVRTTLRRLLWDGSAATCTPPPDIADLLPASGTGFLDALTHRRDTPDGVPGWLTVDNFEVYVDQFTASGFFGPLGGYRNLDADWELTKDLAAPPMPCAFIGGDKDMVIAHRMENMHAMATLLPDFRGATIVNDAGHWTQQEQPEKFNEALLAALDTIDRH